MRTMSYGQMLSGMLSLCMISACGQTYNSVQRIDTVYDIAEGKCKKIWLEAGIPLHETPEHDWGITCVFDTYGSATACRMIGGYEFTGVNPYNGDPGYKLCGLDIHYEETCDFDPLPYGC